MTQSPKNAHQESTQPITELTLAELEDLIKKIVRRTLQENSNNIQTSKSFQIFDETFGSWSESRNLEDIVNEIYESRTLDKSENSL